MRIDKLHNLAVTVSFVVALMTCGDALAASSTFTAATDDDNNGYNGTVTAGGDGYAFKAEDSARYYKFLYLNDDLLLDGAVCAGSTNWYTAYIGTHAWHPVTVTVTNGARMVTGKERNILFRGMGGTIVVSEPSDAAFTWDGKGDKITTVFGDTFPNLIGTVGYTSKFTLCSDVSSDTGASDILRLLAHGTASYQFISNQNANVAARILFDGGELRSIYDDDTKFQVADGAKIVLQSVDGNPIRLRIRPYSQCSLFKGAGTLETAGDGDFVLLSHYYSAKTVMLGADEGGRIVWGNAGNFKLGGRMCLKLTSDDVLPHGEGKGKVMIAVGEYSGTGTSEDKPLVIDLNGTANTVNAIAIGGNTGYSKWHVVTNSSASVATLGLDIWNTESEQRLHELMPVNVKLAANASSTIKFKKLGAAKLMVVDPQATNVLESVAGTEVADGVLWFGNNYALTRPLSVTGSGSIQVREDVQYARTLDLSAIADADLSIGGLTVDTAYYYGKTPTITKFRPAANGKLYLTNVAGELPASYTVPINLTTVVDAENFASWKVYVNGAEARGYVPVYENGVLKAKRKHGLAIFVR